MQLIPQTHCSEGLQQAQPDGPTYYIVSHRSQPAIALAFCHHIPHEAIGHHAGGKCMLAARCSA